MAAAGTAGRYLWQRGYPLRLWGALTPASLRRWRAIEGCAPTAEAAGA